MDKHPLRIYLAEDENIILNWIKSELINMGYEVIGYASDGKTAVEEVKQLKPDIIIMDINMPKLDGLSAVEQIVADQLIPVIIISGYSDPDLIDRANEAGVFGYLVKPIDIKELCSTIKIAQRRFEEFRQISHDFANVKSALEERKFIEKAKGILMERFGLSEEQAMKAMQKKSRNTNKKLVRVAKDIIVAEKII
jgi:response regulator NasT